MCETHEPAEEVNKIESRTSEDERWTGGDQRQNVYFIYTYPCIQNWIFKKKKYFSFLIIGGVRGVVGHRIAAHLQSTLG